MQFLEVVPAYGHTYPHLSDARAAWEGGADFRLVSGPYGTGTYLSVRDTPWCNVMLRYGRDGNRLATLATGREQVAECARCGAHHAEGQGHSAG